MVRPLAFVTVRKKQDDGRALSPLHLARGDELVDDRLRAVGEVAELRLPQDERFGSRNRIAVFEAHGRELAQQRVIDIERRLVVGQVRERRVLLRRTSIDQHRVPLAERSPP